MTSLAKFVALIALVSVAACGGSDSDGEDTQALKDRIAALESASSAPEATPPTQPAATERSTASSPSATPVTVDFAMPNLVKTNLQDAQNAVQELGVFFSISHDMLGSRNQALDSNWKVCTQTPAAGTQITGPASEFEGKFDFGSVKLTEDCP